MPIKSNLYLLRADAADCEHEAEQIRKSLKDKTIEQNLEGKTLSYNKIKTNIDKLVSQIASNNAALDPPAG